MTSTAALGGEVLLALVVFDSLFKNLMASSPSNGGDVPLARGPTTNSLTSYKIKSFLDCVELLARLKTL